MAMLNNQRLNPFFILGDFDCLTFAQVAIHNWSSRLLQVLRVLDSEITTAEIQHHDAADMTGHDGTWRDAGDAERRC